MTGRSARSSQRIADAAPGRRRPRRHLGARPAGPATRPGRHARRGGRRAGAASPGWSPGCRGAPRRRCRSGPGRRPACPAHVWSVPERLHDAATRTGRWSSDRRRDRPGDRPRRGRLRDARRAAGRGRRGRTAPTTCSTCPGFLGASPLGSGSEVGLALSPDGRRLAYAWSRAGATVGRRADAERGARRRPRLGRRPHGPPASADAGSAVELDRLVARQHLDGLARPGHEVLDGDVVDGARAARPGAWRPAVAPPRRCRTAEGSRSSASRTTARSPCSTVGARPPGTVGCSGTAGCPAPRR